MIGSRPYYGGPGLMAQLGDTDGEDLEVCRARQRIRLESSISFAALREKLRAAMATRPVALPPPWPVPEERRTGVK
jgi:hypothetical protein